MKPKKKLMPEINALFAEMKKTLEKDKLRRSISNDALKKLKEAREKRIQKQSQMREEEIAKKITVLDIPDNFSWNDPKLRELIIEQYQEVGGK